MSMNIYFHASPEDLAAVGEDYVLNETVCRRCEGGYFDHELHLWSRSGALLATSGAGGGPPGLGRGRPTGFSPANHSTPLTCGHSGVWWRA